MKIIKIIFGSLAGIYAIAQVFNVIHILSVDKGTIHQSSSLFAAVSALLLGAALSIALFRSAFKTIDEDRQETLIDTDNFPESEISTDYSELGGNYFARHWRGELSLNLAFWVNFVLLNIVRALFNAAISSNLIISNPVLISRIMVFHFFITFLVVYPWQIVGLWRTSTKHILRTGNHRTGRMVQVFIIFGLLITLGKMPMLIPIHKDYCSIGFTKDEFDNYTLEMKKDNTIIHLKGTLGFGVSKKVNRLLKEYPQVEAIILDSGGGRLYEGRQLAKLITTYRLDTYSLTQCSSAAAIAFIAGQRRCLGNGAVMGYHQYKLDYANLEPFADMDKEQQFDLASFRKQGVKEDFLSKLFNAPHDDLWFPANDEMLQAGVIDEVINPIDLLGDEYKLDIKEFEKGLLEVELYQAIKKYEPETYKEVMQAFTEQINKGATMLEMQAAGSSIIEAMAGKLMPVTSDEALIGFANAFVKTISKAADADPKLGVKLLFPQLYGTPDLSGHFTLNEQLIMPKAMEKIVLDAYEKENPDLDIDAAELHLEQIRLKIKDDAKYLNPMGLKSKEDYKRCCEAMIKFYRLILAEDEKTSANTLRSIFTQAQK